MDDYREMVEQRARDRNGEPFDNSSADHAAIVLEKMFRHADDEICIISSHLNAHVFGKEEVVSEADAFLSNTTHKVRIVIEDDVETISVGHRFAEVLRRHPASYEVRQMSAALAEQVPYHFTLADQDSYRFEPDKDEWKAIACFGDAKGAQHLHSVFNTIWNGSAPVTLPGIA